MTAVVPNHRSESMPAENLPATPDPATLSPAVPSVVALLVVHNRLELTQRCLHALFDSKGSFHLSVVVVDDGSTDGTAAWLAAHQPPLEHVTGNGQLWFGGGMDLGLRHVREHFSAANFLLVLNNDTFVYPGSLQAMIEGSQGRHSVAATLWITDRGIPGTAGFRWHWWRGIEDVCLHSDWRRAFEKREAGFLSVDAVATTLALHPMQLIRQLRMVSVSWHPHNRYDAAFSARVREQGGTFLVSQLALADHEYGNVAARPSLRHASWTKIWNDTLIDRRSVFHFQATVLMIWETAPNRWRALPVIARQVLLVGRVVAGKCLLDLLRVLHPSR